MYLLCIRFLLEQGMNKADRPGPGDQPRTVYRWSRRAS